ncbi:carboxymuconolactone decarboxylase [Pigmentiphaga sp. NML080357]|uniref:carboxymuconolactone decarboxylase family protein n=1 Tax=Pigmentiphaga sp. NML080357 TaxID=2008675 RepID=UPI000B4143EC|nr:carboxymuconolactone decarboxylase family protein [Pigmentiphaga sp. NML080357]OVZ60664.1 carboxymuconolactone decarboxylase [Pigmentiphaga sp. NML080357]
MTSSRPDPQFVQDTFGHYSDSVASKEERARGYREMAGFLPPRVQARLDVTGALDPQMLDLQEKVRAHALDSAHFDAKQVQLLIFAMLVAELSDAAIIHGVAARRAGASWQELQSVVNLAYVFRGVSAANRGADMLIRIAERERELAAQA